MYRALGSTKPILMHDQVVITDVPLSLHWPFTVQMECLCPGVGHGHKLDLEFCTNCRVWVSSLGPNCLLGFWGWSLPGIIGLFAWEVICVCQYTVALGCSSAGQFVVRPQGVSAVSAVWFSVVSHSCSQGALTDRALAADGSLSLGTAPWASVFVSLQHLQVMVHLATDQSKFAGDALWDGLFVLGFVPPGDEASVDC